MVRFALGQLVLTAGVNEAVASGQLRPLDFLRRHAQGDWGDLDPEDKAMNDAAVASGDDRIFSAYKITGVPGENKIWIITERSRSYTTILYPHEY